MLPYSNVGLVRRFNALSVKRTVRACLDELGVVDPCVVATVPNACDYLDGIGGGRVVYYCVDDFAEWPGHQSDLVRAMEDRLVSRADVLVATSNKLYERLRKSGKPTSLLTHGVDIDLFAADAPAEHSALAGIPRPRAGYFGLFDERSDQQLIADLAAQVPDYSFVFAGPVETSVARLEQLRNVHFTGPIPYTELPAFIAGMNALLIPYAVNEFADSLSPLKLKEYLATGKPVISTPIADMRQWQGDVAVGNGAAEWADLLHAAESEDVAMRRKRASSLLAGETWRDKAVELLRLCKPEAETRRG
jgi:glycosyltransferase involved in cell wall biosynthesis